VPPETLASETVWRESCQPDVSSGKVVPTGGRLVLKFGVAPFSVTGVALPKVGAPAAVIQTLALQDGGGLLKVRTLDGVVLPDVVLPDVVLPDVVLPDVVLPDVLVVVVGVFVATVLPPPPLEQAAKAARQIEDARRVARPLHTVSMRIPQVIVFVQGHGNRSPRLNQP
jgi:hypothetical protein